MSDFTTTDSVYPVPQVGMGATELLFSDRHPYTIIKVNSPKKITLQQDRAVRIDQNGLSEIQEYRYEPDTQGPTRVATLRKNGRWITQGESIKNGAAFALGYREEYYDFSF